MATLIGKFLNSTWSSSANWTNRATGAPATPADGDELELVSSAVAAVTGSDERATEIVSLTVGKSFTTAIGTSGAWLQLDCPRVIWNGRSASAWVSFETHAYTDIVINGADNTIITSAAQPFTSAHVGLSIKITGGTGFTAGTYEVLSVAGGNATLDAAVGTVASTGGTGHFQISLAVKGTASIDPAEITTTGLHIKCSGDADLLDPKIDGGYLTIEAEGGSGTCVGTLTSQAVLLHTYMTLNNATTISVFGVVVNWKPMSSGPTIRIHGGGMYDQQQTSLTIPASGPAVVMEGGILRWFATAIVGSIDGTNAGAIDFSEATARFQIDGATIVGRSSLNIANGIRTPTFAGGVQFRGVLPQWTLDGNVDVADVTYV